VNFFLFQSKIIASQEFQSFQSTRAVPELRPCIDSKMRDLCTKVTVAYALSPSCLRNLSTCRFRSSFSRFNPSTSTLLGAPMYCLMYPNAFAGRSGSSYKPTKKDPTMIEEVQMFSTKEPPPGLSVLFFSTHPRVLLSMHPKLLSFPSIFEIPPFWNSHCCYCYCCCCYCCYFAAGSA
jgi:hypothetical protein